MTCTAVSHQGAIKEPTASLLRTSETHPGVLHYNTTRVQRVGGASLFPLQMRYDQMRYLTGILSLNILYPVSTCI